MNTSELDITAAVWITAALTLVLVGLHLAAPWIRRLPMVPERYTGSFAGGLAVAYVFLHLLPEIAAGNEAIGEALQDVVEPTPLLELAVFLVALAGFTLFYGLERLATAHGSRESRPTAVSTSTGGGAVESAGVYWLHLGAFMVYNVLITYTMVLRVRTGVWFAVLFTVAIGLHFLLTDRSLAEHYPRRFRTHGRLLLAAALVLGSGLATVAAPTSTVIVALLTAFIGGSTLLNVFKEEVPSNRSSSFGWFLTGLVLYAVLLAGVTILEG
ncbi:hypothetical protein [Citricoccus alkalitolerans]|uniref:ZIP Zinc transporter n=1 Tax=Citricoccus alkalitolerans TaxID=246603 RepID=A0ABV8Y1M5_9MICC